MEQPVRLAEAIENMEGDAVATIAAFILLAGVWHHHDFKRNPLVPQDELEVAGFNEWKAVSSGPRLRVSLRDLEFANFLGSEPMANLVEAVPHQRLSSSIRRAVQTGDRLDAARAILEGFRSPHSLIRACAYLSSLDAFVVTDTLVGFLRENSEHAQHLLLLTRADDGETSLAELEMSILRILSQRIGYRSEDANTRAPAPDGVQSKASDLMLIHGTVLGGEPDWCFPHTGDLFNYIKNNLRPGLYGAPDYFTWEGSVQFFGDWGRRQAARNLIRWVRERQLEPIDCVTHSHGGNVLILATKECSFRDVLFLSCPVRKDYKLKRYNVSSAKAVRTKFDLVLLATRSHQRFPAGSEIKEIVLPIWFFGHSSTRMPSIWQKYTISI